MHGKDNKKRIGVASDKHTSIISLLEEGGERNQERSRCASLRATAAIMSNGCPYAD